MPQTPIDGTIGHVQFLVGQGTAKLETFVDSVPLYMAARVGRSGDDDANTLPGLQPLYIVLLGTAPVRSPNGAPARWRNSVITRFWMRVLNSNERMVIAAPMKARSLH